MDIFDKIEWCLIALFICAPIAIWTHHIYAVDANTNAKWTAKVAVACK